MKALFIVAVTAVACITTSCKKGDDDPFFSLLSRKARISGEWKLAAINSSWSSVNESGEIFEGSEMSDGITLTTEQDLGYFSISSSSVIHDYSFTIHKDGRWERKADFTSDMVRQYPDNKESSQGRVTRTESGTWAFVNKTKEVAKNKERVIFYLLESTIFFDTTTAYTDYDDVSIPDQSEFLESSTYTYTYDQGKESFTYDIRMLKSKEMKWTLSQGGTSAFVSPEFGGANNYSSTIAGSEEITWVIE